MQDQKTIVGATLAGVLALGLVGQALGAEAKGGGEVLWCVQGGQERLPDGDECLRRQQQGRQ